MDREQAEPSLEELAQVPVESLLSCFPEAAKTPETLLGLLQEHLAARILRRNESFPLSMTDQYLEQFPDLKQNADRRDALIRTEFVYRWIYHPVFDLVAYRMHWPKELDELFYDILLTEVTPEAEGLRFTGERRCGGQAVVFRAMQLVGNEAGEPVERAVAVKAIPIPIGGVSFSVETRALARHSGQPHVVTFHQCITDRRRQFFLFIMEWCDGDLWTDIQHDGPLEIRKAAELVESLATAVHTANQAGLIHGDLKPKNVLRSHGVYKIADFGLAHDLNITGRQAGGRGGTPNYLAPERLETETQPDRRVDVYGLGAILYESLTGKQLYPNHLKWEELRSAIQTGICHRPRGYRPKLSKRLESVCLKALARDPSTRYQSAKELADELGRYRRHEPVQALPASRLERIGLWCRRHPLPVLFVLLFSVSLMGAGSFWRTQCVEAENLDLAAAIDNKSSENNELKQLFKNTEESNAINDIRSLYGEYRKGQRFRVQATSLLDESLAEQQAKENEETIQRMKSIATSRSGEEKALLIALAEAQEEIFAQRPQEALVRLDNHITSLAMTYGFQRELLAIQACALLRLGNHWTESFQLSEQMLQNNPEDAIALWRSAYCLRKLNRWVECLGRWEQFLKVTKSPGLINRPAMNVVAHAEIGFSCLKLHRFRQGLAAFNTCLPDWEKLPPIVRGRQDESFIGVRLGRGKCAKALPDQQQIAIEDFTFVVEHVTALVKAGRNDLAGELSEEVCELAVLRKDPTKAHGDLDQAEEILKSVGQPNNSVIWANVYSTRGVIYGRQKGNEGKALAVLAKAIEIFDAAIARSKGDEFRELLELTAGAKSNYGICARSNGMSIANLRKGVAYLNEAQQSYKKCIELIPNETDRSHRNNLRQQQFQAALNEGQGFVVLYSNSKLPDDANKAKDVFSRAILEIDDVLSGADPDQRLYIMTVTSYMARSQLKRQLKDSDGANEDLQSAINAQLRKKPISTWDEIELRRYVDNSFDLAELSTVTDPKARPAAIIKAYRDVTSNIAAEQLSPLRLGQTAIAYASNSDYKSAIQCLKTAHAIAPNKAQKDAIQKLIDEYQIKHIINILSEIIINLHKGD